LKKSELLKYIGNLTQIGGSRHYELTDGWGRNLRAIDVNTGSGLQYTILPDRGMDISLAGFKGTNLVYITCTGETHPSYFEPEELGWLRTFTGGLLTTCGITYLGTPVTDEGEKLGLHGRYSTLPAKQVADLSGWIGDEFHILLRGIIEEARIFGNKLRLEREIRTILGQNSLHITDTVTNFGFTPSPYTILYHMNFGYPLLDEHAELVIDPEMTLPRDDTAAAGINEFRSFSRPQPGFQEQVFNHKMKAGPDGKAIVTLKNKKAGIALHLKFDVAELPYLIEWKMMGQGEYALGLEPSNVLLKNRKQLREEGILPYLRPDESITNHLEVRVEEIS
jgi:galactose mutarotase-like enzyme